MISLLLELNNELLKIEIHHFKMVDFYLQNYQTSYRTSLIFSIDSTHI